jgi:hypothetical protein
MSRPFTVVAIVAAHNEADIIESVVRDLIAQGIHVYYIDDDSTDGTREAVEQYVGRGVIGVEQFDGAPGAFEWERLLRRKEELASTLDADWFIHHDADEFRESPWPNVSLSEAIGAVDRRGYNAIDFVRYDFWPTDDDASHDDGDVRCRLTRWCEPKPYDRLQVRCWKRNARRVDLASSGGHEAAFADRLVCPIPFILRHYPVRGTAHGERKLLDRRTRFTPRERERGWHVQYDGVADSGAFVRPAAQLESFDATAIRVNHHLDTATRVTALESTIVELQAAGSALRTDLAELATIRERLAQALDEAEARFQSAAALADRRAQDVRDQAGTIAALEDERATQNAELARLRQAVADLEQHRATLLSSFSWRVTAPARAILRPFIKP